VERKLSRRFNVQDAAFLYFEKRNEPMHIGSVAIFEGRVSFDRFVEHLRSRMHLIPRYRQRVMFVPFGLAYPSWEYDPDFDILNHVRRVTLPPPGDEDQLARLAGDLFAKPLDRRKPLWEIYLIEGVEGGNSAWLAKVHHCLVDGVAGIDLLMVTLDVSPNPAPPPPAEPLAAPPLPGTTTVLSNAVSDLVGDFVRNLGELQLNLANPLGYVRRLRHILGALEATAPFFQRAAPRTPFNTTLSTGRRIAWSEMSFAEIRGIRSSLGGTINDVVLAIVTGALGRYLALHGQNTDSLELRFMIPVNVRQEEESTAMGNRISAMFAALPVGIANPVARLKAVREKMVGLKQIGQAAGISAVFDLLALAAPMALRAVSNMARVPNVLLNLVCTNVPGPMIPLYTVGHRLLAHYPLVPIAWDMGLGVAITSYDHKLYFGLMADAKAVPDIHRLKQALDEAFVELREAAGVPPSDLPTLFGRSAAEAVLAPAPGTTVATKAS